METSTQANITSFTISEKTWLSFAADWRIPASVPLSDFIDRVKGLSDRGYGVVDLGYCGYRIKLPSSTSSTIELEIKVAELVKLIDFGQKEPVCFLTLYNSTWSRHAKKHKLPIGLTYSSYCRLMCKLATMGDDFSATVKHDNLRCYWMRSTQPLPEHVADHIISSINADIVEMYTGSNPLATTNHALELDCDVDSAVASNRSKKQHIAAEDGYPIDSSKTVVVSLPSATSNDRPTAATSTNTHNTKDNKKRDTIMATARETSNIQPANTSESIGNKFDKAKSRAGRLAKEAGHRIAVRQGAKTAKVVISSVLPEQQRASFVSATDTTIGDAAFRGLLAMIVPALPGIRDDAKERISDELFVGAMQDVGTEAFEKVTGPLVQALVQIYGRGVLTEPETAPRSGLESGNG
jgi:hypothetical protein